MSNDCLNCGHPGDIFAPGGAYCMDCYAHWASERVETGEDPDIAFL